MGDARVCARESKLYEGELFGIIESQYMVEIPFLIIILRESFGTWTHKMGIRIPFFHTRFSYFFFCQLLLLLLRLQYICEMLLLYPNIISERIIERWLLSTWFKYVSIYIMKRCFQIALPSVFMNVIEILVIYILSHKI